MHSVVQGLMVERSRLLNVRMTEDEMAMIRDLAERFGLSQSDTIRQLVRRAHAEPASARPKPRKRALRTNA
jgi:hypothetical protein